MMGVDDSSRRLMWHGMFLFLLGLLTGLVEQHFTNPRMGLAAHLEGVMNGTFLVALGAIWVEVRLSARAKAGITGAGHGALPWQETVVTAGFMTVGIAIIA